MRGMSATWLSPTNILSHRKVPFQKMLPPPTGKSLKKGGPSKISNKVVYVHCVTKAVGQTNTVRLCPPPQARLGPYAHVVSCLPHLETLAFIEETKFASRKAKIIKYFPPNSQTFDR
jgi:hypothetical protein